MASEQSKDQTNPDELTCQICECLFYNPVRLPCSHSFCKVCVEVHWELESTQTEILCPQKECGWRWESKPTLTKDTKLETLADKVKEKLVSEKLDEIRREANEREATEEGNASSPQSSPPAQGGGEIWSRACRKLVGIFPEWKTERIEVLKMLAGMIVKLRKRSRNRNISKVGGTFTSIVITILALIPVTLGFSIAGMVIQAVLAIIAEGVLIAVLVKNNASKKEAKENIKKDKIFSKKLAKVVESVNSAASELEIVTMDTLVSERKSTKGGDVPAGTEETHRVIGKRIAVARGMMKRTTAIVKKSKELVKSAASTEGVASVVVKGVRIAGIAVSSMSLAVDVASLIQTGIDLHKGSPSEIEAHWQKKYNKLKLHLIGMAKYNDYFKRIGNR